MKRSLILLWLLLSIAASAAEDLHGFYVGEFEAAKLDESKQPMYFNKINISIDSIKGGTIKGHSVVAGNNRPFTGTIAKKGDVYEVVAREPGDDPYDGKFVFTVYPKSQRVNGYWVANDQKLAVTSRRYDLHKTTFKYNPDQELDESFLEGHRSLVYDYNRIRHGDSSGEAFTKDAAKFNASKRALSSQDVENMYKRDLELMRNTIYARHGYSFQNREMRYFFDHVDWYIPVSTNVTSQLTDIERKNIELLKRYENHAATYYDSFGR